MDIILFTFAYILPGIAIFGLNRHLDEAVRPENHTNCSVFVSVIALR